MLDFTLRDRLAHLSPGQVEKRLGRAGKSLIRAGGALAADAEFQWRSGQLELFIDGATVEVFADPSAPMELGLACSTCRTERGECVHGAGALQFVLEDKVTLGLAALPPDPDQASTAVSEQALVERAVEQRRERAESEPMTLRSSQPKSAWTDYTVTSRLSGRTYRVALRGRAPGQSYCSCPDFRKNTLGTCKHILHALSHVEQRFRAASLAQPPGRWRTSAHLVYGDEVELRVSPADRLDREASAALAPFVGRAVHDPARLARALAALAAAGHPVTVHADAEEWMRARLVQSHLGAVARAIRGDPASHPLRTTLLDAELLPYQLDGIGFAVGAGRAILADDMGLGKTIQGIGVAELLAREAGVERVLVICPASIKSQWAAEIERCSERSAQVVIGRAGLRWQQYGAAFFSICNYEQVLRDGSVIGAANFDLVILDEAQRIKNWEAKTSAAVKAIQTPFALALTGTPLENRIDELLSIVEFIDERRLAPAFRFFHRHRVMDELGRVVGYRDLDALRARLAPVMLRRTRTQVLEELPPCTTQVVRVEPTPEQAELHVGHYRTAQRIASKKYLTEMDLVRLQKALLMCRMAADSAALLGPDEPEASSKLERLDGLLRSLLAEPDRKVLVFSEWTRMLDRVEARLVAAGNDPLRLDGSVPQAKRKRMVARFQDEPSARVMLLSNAGATGLNLQAADTVVNVDLPWNPAVLEQRIGRAHRMGQLRPVRVYLMVTAGTLEESMLGTLAAKHELFQAVLDPDSDVTEVAVGGGLEALRRRLEVLLGNKPGVLRKEVGVDEPSASLARTDGASKAQRLAQAAGTLVQAAFDMIAELVPEEHGAASPDPAAEAAAQRLMEGARRDECGRPTLPFTLEDDEALETLVRTIERLAWVAQRTGASTIAAASGDAQG